MKSYIKLNDNNNYLSLGNIFNVIKKIAINKTGAIQTEIFCILFSIDDISETTVGNYCTGYRSIGNSYKQIYINYQKKWEKDKTILINTISNLISIIEGYNDNYDSIEEINKNISLKKLCDNIHILVKNDLYIPINKKKEFLSLLNNNNYYEFLCLTLFYAILENTQPLTSNVLVSNTIESILENTNLSIIHLKEYLEIEFKEGISLIPSLKKLAANNNPYALHKLGNLEYTGTVAGYPRYDKAYDYYIKAASYNHPKSNWIIANMILNEKIGPLNKDNILLAWDYLEKAYNLNSISAINTIGLCYLKGMTKDKKKDKKKAQEYFEKAASKNYTYAYNNLGKIYEDEKNYKLAFEYYEKSAKNEDSWACNKLGLFYYNGIYVKKDDKLAFHYFSLGANSEIDTRIAWNTYNLVNLFYLKGNTQVGITKDINKSLELLNTIKSFEPANILFLYCYYELYLNNKTDELLDKVTYYLNLTNKIADDKKKKEIEKSLNSIYKINIKL